MKKYLIITLLFFSYNAQSQWIVNDPMNYIANIGSYMENVKKYQQMLTDAKEFLEQTKMLKNAFKEGGMWDKTFKALTDLYEFLEEAKDVISIIHARDAYALIPYLPIDDKWKDKIYTVIDDAHGLVNERQFDYLVSLVSDKNPVLSDFLIRSRAIGRGGLDHRLNSYYFVSARQESSQKRIEQIDKQQQRISTFSDMSQGESTNMINSQLTLIQQQNEELIKSLHHQITAKQSDYLDREAQRDRTRQIIIQAELQRQNLDYSKFVTKPE